MATVKICDICGKPVDSAENFWPTDDKVMYINVRKKLDRYMYHEDLFDCCPECSDKILSFIDTMKTYPNRWSINISTEDL